MNRREFQQVAVCVSLSLALLLPQRNVQAQEASFVEIPLDALHDERPVELLGLFSNESLEIPIPRSWLLGEASWIEMKARASALLDSSRSFVTISLNGLHVGSYRLQEIAGKKRRIPIPANMFSQGINTLTFAGTLYLPDDQKTNCQYWDDPARWLTIEPGGMLHLSFVRRDLSVDLSSFPQPFIEPLEGYLPDSEKRPTLFVLPENNTRDDLSSLSAISYALGSSADVKFDWRPEIVTGSQFNANLAANRNVVFIGQTPAAFQGAARNDKDYIAVLPSPWSDGRAVMIVGDQNRQDGFSPASIFSDPARNMLLQGSVGYTDGFAPPAPEPFRNRFTFEDLGHLDRTVRGVGQQNLIYSLYVPYEIDPLLVKLNLALVHSPDLDVQNSSFTVYLNGFSVAGILPADRSSTGMPITVGLPAKRFRPGINFIRIRSDLHLPYHSCERSPESVWATVLNSSSLEITHRDRSPIPSLKHFPLPFSEHPGFLFVIPDRFDQDDLGHLARLSFMMGASAYQVNYPPQVMTASSFIERQAEYRNVMLVGLASENQATMSTNDLLPQPFTEDGKSLQEGYGVYLPTPDNEASVGLLQIIPSPWVRSGTVLVLTGNDPQGLEWTWGVILNPALQDQFTGNLMVVGSASRGQTSGGVSDQGNLLTLFQQIPDASNIPIIGAILQKSGQAFVAPALVAVGAALLLAVGVLLILGVARSRNSPDRTEKTLEREEYE